MEVWYLSHVRAGNDLVTLRKCAVSPGPLQIALQRRDEDTVWYLSHMQIANDLVRLHICTVSPEPSLIALKRRHVDEGSGIIVYSISCDLGTYCICEQGKTRRACTFRQSRQSLH